MNPNWSKRTLKIFTNSKYAVDKSFPEWFNIANRRYRPVYIRWYGL